LLKTLTISEINEQSINQVIKYASDVLSSETSEKNIINEFDLMLTNPKQIDLILFGFDEVLDAFNNGLLRTIYVSRRSSFKNLLLNSNKKTLVVIINFDNFCSKYGELVGVKYYLDETTSIL